MMRWTWCVLLLSLALPGCARTVVTKVTRGNEQGVRFYRPKPYLKIMSTSKADVVSLDIAYLPDFSEEYAARPLTGLGMNETEIQLNENGTLKSFNSSTDAKVAENLEAIASLFKAVPTSSNAKTSPSPLAERPDDNAKMEMRAYGVPLGLYEAVIGKGPDGCKRLCGWRYVGFAPFAQHTPIPCASVCSHEPDSLYGLVNIAGTMVFCPLDELGNSPTWVQARALAMGTSMPSASRDESLAQQYADRLASSARDRNIFLPREQIRVFIDLNSITIIVRGVPETEHAAIRGLASATTDEWIAGGKVWVHFEL